MKRKLGGLLLVMGVALGLMAFRRQATPPDLSSPKATVRSFLGALKRQDVTAVQKCIKGATNQDYLKLIISDHPVWKVVAVNSLIEEIHNSTGHVAAEFTMQVPSSSQPNPKFVPVTMVEMFSLVKQGKTWQLTPDLTFLNFSAAIEYSALEKQAERRPLSFAVAVAASPAAAGILQKAHDQVQEISCLRNMRMIAMGTEMYLQDYNELTPRQGASYVESVDPYIRNMQLFTCPLDPKGTVSYTFNDGIKGIAVSALPSPAQTVMIYEGKDRKLDYRHDGRATVAFMDGRCRLIGPSEAASLIWTVTVPNAVKKPTP